MKYLLGIHGKAIVQDYKCPTCGREENMISMSSLAAVCENCETIYGVLWREGEQRRVYTKTQQDMDDLVIESPRRW